MKQWYLNGESFQLENLNLQSTTVLGPLLFLIYINDLPNISEVLQFYLFTDDTNIYCEDESINKLEKIINKELKKIIILG